MLLLCRSVLSVMQANTLMVTPDTRAAGIDESVNEKGDVYIGWDLHYGRDFAIQKV